MVLLEKRRHFSYRLGQRLFELFNIDRKLDLRLPAYGLLVDVREEIGIGQSTAQIEQLFAQVGLLESYYVAASRR